MALFFVLLWNQLGTMDHYVIHERTEQGYWNALSVANGLVLPTMLILYIMADQLGFIDVVMLGMFLLLCFFL